MTVYISIINRSMNWCCHHVEMMQEMFGADLPSHRPHGVLALGHCSRPEPENGDGLSLTLLVSVRMPLEEVALIDKYSWLKVTEEVAANLLSRMGKFRTVPLNVVRYCCCCNHYYRYLFPF